MTPPLPVGFVGLGAIGTPMAARLAARGPLVVWNRTRARADSFVARHGGTVARTPRELAAACPVVVTCLPNSREVEEVLSGPDGVEEGLAPGGLLLDCTSGEPWRSRAIADRLALRGVSFADAPVSGGTNGAHAGTLVVMIGGTDAVVSRATPILEAFAGRIVHTGVVGTGHAVKAVNNALLGTHIITLAEGLTGLVKAGVAPDRAVEVINLSSGRSFVSEVLVPDRVLTGTWPRTFRLALLTKDAGIACRVLEDAGVDAPVLDAVHAALRSALEALGDAGADYLEAIRVAEERAGVTIRNPEVAVP